MYINYTGSYNIEGKKKRKATSNGYKINMKSTIFADAKQNELIDGYAGSNTFSSIPTGCC